MILLTVGLRLLECDSAVSAWVWVRGSARRSCGVYFHPLWWEGSEANAQDLSFADPQGIWYLSNLALTFRLVLQTQKSRRENWPPQQSNCHTRSTAASSISPKMSGLSVSILGSDHPTYFRLLQRKVKGSFFDVKNTFYLEWLSPPVECWKIYSVEKKL